jgi:ribosomal protein S18 acetylase RimI-like enzyme
VTADGADAALVQDYLRRTAARHRDVVHVPGFTCTIDPHDDLKYLNYAIPDGPPADPAAIRPVYRGRDRLARLEWVEEHSPWLEARARASGFREESRVPLMTCRPEEARAIAPPAGVAIEPVGDVRALLEVQREAFGDTRTVDDDAVARWRGIALLARVDGEPAGVAGITPPHDGLSEVVGIGVRARFRRRGIAAALTSAITQAAFARGVRVAFLTPGDEATGRIYARAGYARSLTVLAFAD